jgi:HPt (histidine-containing phosphotransfer) domain-containing protein
MSTSMQIPEEMKRQYIHRRRGDLAKLIDAASRADAEPFHRIGHQLKGNAATYGYLELEALGVRLEEMQTFDSGKADGLIREFQDWLSLRERELV